MKINPTADTCPKCGSYRPGYPFTPDDPCLNCRGRPRRTSPLPWRVEKGFASASILAADDSLVAESLTPSDAEAIVAALGVVEAARLMPHSNVTCSHGPDCERCFDEVIIGDVEQRALYAALSAYDDATR